MLIVSRFCRGSILAMHLFQRIEITQHFKMNGSLWICNELTHRNIHCCNISPIMNYDRARIIGPLGQIAFLPQATALELVFNWAETTSFRQSWDEFGLNPSVIAVFIYAKKN